MLKLKGLLLGAAAAMLMLSASVYAEVIDLTNSSQAIGGYSSDQSKSLGDTRLGGTQKGIVGKYTSNNSGNFDAKVTLVKIEMSNLIGNGVAQASLKLSGGNVKSNRNGNINVYAALADPTTTVESGQTAIGENWTKSNDNIQSAVCWNTRPQLSTAPVSKGTFAANTKDEVSIDITELLRGQSGYVTIALLGETEDESPGMQGDRNFTQTKLEYTPITVEGVTSDEGNIFIGTDGSRAAAYTFAVPLIPYAVSGINVKLGNQSASPSTPTVSANTEITFGIVVDLTEGHSAPEASAFKVTLN